MTGASGNEAPYGKNQRTLFLLDGHSEEMVEMPDGHVIPYKRAEQWVSAFKNDLHLLQTQPPRSWAVSDLVEWMTLRRKQLAEGGESGKDGTDADSK